MIGNLIPGARLSLNIIDIARRIRHAAIFVIVAYSGVASAQDNAAWLAYFLAAADGGLCIESETFKAIRDEGTAQTLEIVQSSLDALAQRADQQRALGCSGDIAAQAIAAGADPDAVLAATAAGL